MEKLLFLSHMGIQRQIRFLSNNTVMPAAFLAACLLFGVTTACNNKVKPTVVNLHGGDRFTGRWHSPERPGGMLFIIGGRKMRMPVKESIFVIAKQDSFYSVINELNSEMKPVLFKYDSAAARLYKSRTDNVQNEAQEQMEIYYRVNEEGKLLMDMLVDGNIYTIESDRMK